MLMVLWVAWGDIGGKGKYEIHLKYIFAYAELVRGGGGEDSCTPIITYVMSVL
jgi:hypothetical protein